MSRPILPSFFDNSAAMADEWDIVIKVKHGDTLRRISAYAIGQCMDHDMGKLRVKIISLFKFSADAELILTYTDEDGDQVTLDNDDELRDAIVHQRLNPLRINVKLKPNTGRSVESPQLETPVNTQSTDEPPKSVPEPVINPLSNLFSIAQKAALSSPTFAQVDEVMKSEPFKSAISNLSKDVMKAASSSPTCGQLVEAFSKLGLSNASQSSGSTGESSGGTGGASSQLMDLNIPVDPKVSNNLTLPSETISVNPEPKPNSSDNAKKTWDVSFATPLNTGAATTVTASPLIGLTGQWSANKSPELEKEVGSSCREGKSVANTETNFPGSSWFPASAWYPGSFVPQQQFPLLNGGSTSKQMPGQVSSPAESGIGSHFGPPPFCPGHEQGPPPPLSGLKSSHFGPSGTSAYHEVPFGELPYDVSDPFWTGPPFAHPYYPTSHSYNGNAQQAFHRGVQCDGCGVHPIVGLRYKSNVMEDYDLCNLCYLQADNKLDYTRIFHSSIVRSLQRAPKLLKDFHKHHLRYHTPSFKQLHGSCLRAPRAKLESSFVKDVTVLDGTLMPPSTHFTKIWRMQNNGTVAWPVGTQLLWVGGDKLGDRVSAQLEIAVNGLPVNNELDIAVDFTAPLRPGRYVSYWKMASPTGHKFGQRVWVLIQVDYSRTNSAAGVINLTPDLNVPPESSNQDESEIIDVNAEPLDGEFSVTNLTGTTEELVNKTVVVDVPNSLLDSTIDELPKTTPESVFSRSSSSSSLIDMPATSSVEKVTADRNSMEETLLKELEAKGFRQIDLNKEILRLNEYNLEQSVDDLCGFAEWDPLLSELHEMGFYDHELNKKVLIKNGGSIKRAVLDLIAGGKPE